MRSNIIVILTFVWFVAGYAKVVSNNYQRGRSIEEQIVEKHHYHTRVCEELREVVDEAVENGDLGSHDAAVFMNNCYNRGA